MAKKNEQEVNICSCGRPNPEHRGYCTECVTKLKARYDQLLDELEELEEEKDSYNTADMDKANEKLKLMRNKAEQYEIKLSDAQMLDVLDRHQRLAESDDNRDLAEHRVLV